MASQEQLLCIDIGGDSVKVAEFSYPQGGGIVLEKFAFCEYGGEMKEEEELLDALSDSLRDTILENGFKSKKVNLSISGQSAFIRIVKLPPMSDEESKVRQLVEYEAKQTVPFPMSEVVWDYQLISGGEDSSEIEVMFVVVKNGVIERVTRIMEELGKEVAMIEVAPTASYNAARANDIGDKECEMILNIGGRCSTLVFIDNGRFFVRTIPIAGHSITQQISKEFGISFVDAEEMKRRHGFVALGGAYEEPDSEVAATVSKIVRNVMTRLHGEINRSINVYRAQQKGRKPEKLHLAGGSSVMAFTPRFFSEKLRIPVEYFNPFMVVSLSQGIDKENLAEVAHMFSETIGLGLRSATVCPIEISLVPEAIKKQNELKLKMPYFYASAASLILCLGITWWGFSKQHFIASEKIKLATEEVNKTTDMLGQVNRARGELTSAENDFESAKKLLEGRKQWVSLLNELQSILPDRIWLVKIKGSPKANASGSSASSPSPGEMGGLFDPFASTRTQPTVTVDNSSIEWVVLKGHSYVSKDHRIPFEEILMSNINKSPKFSDKRDDINTISLETTRGNYNITSFEIEAKLKEPIKKQ